MISAVEQPSRLLLPVPFTLTLMTITVEVDQLKEPLSSQSRLSRWVRVDVDVGLSVARNAGGAGSSGDGATRADGQDRRRRGGGAGGVRFGRRAAGYVVPRDVGAVLVRKRVLLLRRQAHGFTLREQVRDLVDSTRALALALPLALALTLALALLVLIMPLPLPLPLLRPAWRAWRAHSRSEYQIAQPVLLLFESVERSVEISGESFPRGSCTPLCSCAVGGRGVRRGRRRAPEVEDNGMVGVRCAAPPLVEDEGARDVCGGFGGRLLLLGLVRVGVSLAVYTYNRWSGGVAVGRS